MSRCDVECVRTSGAVDRREEAEDEEEEEEGVEVSVLVGELAVATGVAASTRDMCVPDEVVVAPAEALAAAARIAPKLVASIDR